ncbi:hypothetical protein SCODD09_01381 [Streptococcus constellatus]|nr:hypothetical protein SCODD09_01381 [Streptococcus constellatus]
MTINIDIDQFTLVFKTDEIENSWYETCCKIITSIAKKIKLFELYDGIEPTDRSLPSGYNQGFEIPNAAFYFRFAFHSDRPKMGIIMKMSAQAWTSYRKRYLEKFSTPLNLHTFLQNLYSEEYSMRLSRVDFYCDFIDEDISIPTLNRSIETGRTELRYGRYLTRKSHSRK